MNDFIALITLPIRVPIRVPRRLPSLFRSSISGEKFTGCPRWVFIMHSECVFVMLPVFPYRPRNSIRAPFRPRFFCVDPCPRDPSPGATKGLFEALPNFPHGRSFRHSSNDRPPSNGGPWRKSNKENCLAQALSQAPTLAQGCWPKKWVPKLRGRAGFWLAARALSARGAAPHGLLRSPRESRPSRRPQNNAWGLFRRRSAALARAGVQGGTPRHALWATTGDHRDPLARGRGT